MLIFSTATVMATHNRAGEITYRKIGTYQFEIKIVTYTKTSSPADRPELEFWWGDGDRDTLPRNQIDLNVGPDIQRNTYFGTHTYPGNGSYTMYFIDENRNGGVINIQGSVNIPFYVETRLIISPAITTNNSPQLLQPPIDDGAVNRLFIHNPNAYDPDGDSLSYELVPCKGIGGQPIPTFSYPAASVSFSLDAITGDLIWDSPQSIGEYNVAMIIREWRTIPGIGLLNIGYVTRDMQITIYPPINDPPVITAINDTCIEAGTTLTFTVTATDPNAGESVTLTASGGPFNVLTSPATFISTPNIGTATGDFEWNSTCAHVRKNPYAAVFKAKDDNSQVQLADLEQVFITVVGPSPKNPFATPLGNSLVLNWDQSACSEAIGYKIYRKISTYGFTPSLCETGVPAYTGYVFIATVNGLTNLTFTDDNNGQGLAPAVNYCYMVTAYYPDGAESYASVEFCSKLIRDLPVITNVDVSVTNTTTGEIKIAWGKPTELDFTQTPGPFRYVLQRSVGGGAFIDVVTYNNLNDTLYTDLALNTQNTQYTYRVQFWNDTPGNTFQIGFTQTATSIFLSIAPGDEKNNLNYTLNVPWTNYIYVIYRQNSFGTFDSIGTSTTLNYTDDSLVNGLNYCYYVESRGAYQDTGLVNPIINRSEIFCSTPIDNEAPCPPTLSHFPYCEELTDTLSWITDPLCAFDVATYQLYFRAVGTTDFILIATLPVGTNSFIFTDPISIAGCYYITATDSTGNIGLPSNQVCEESCPSYELPNIFTPDGNGINDTFHPFRPYRDVRSVDMIIYNRWGAQMFKTSDPEIGWNGKKDNTGEDAPDGVYFYICKVYEQFLDSSNTRILKGFVHITRGSQAQ